MITISLHHHHLNTSSVPFSYSIFKGVDHHSSRPCLVREIHLPMSSKGAALNLCRKMATPLSWCESAEIVKIVHVGLSDERGREGQPGSYPWGDKLYFVTDFFHDSIKGLASYLHD